MCVLLRCRGEGWRYGGGRVQLREAMHVPRQLYC